MRPEIDIDLLRKLLRYEPATGKLYWFPRPVSMFEPTDKKTAEHQMKWWNNRFAGAEAFTAICADGFHGKIFGQNYYAHRVAWALKTGEWPTHEVDHRDGQRSNNRFDNLRAVTHAVNMKNKRLYKSGNGVVHGIVPRKAGTWQAHIAISGKRRHLGTFKCFGRAVAARKAAEKEQNYFHNHGRAA